MHPAEYAEFLSWRIDAMDAQLEELQPNWEVPGLKRSYVDLTVCGVLTELYDRLAAA